MRHFKVKATEHTVPIYGRRELTKLHRLWHLYVKEDGWFKGWEFRCAFWADTMEEALDEARSILQEVEDTF